MVKITDELVSIPTLRRDEFTAGEHLGSGGFAIVFSITLKDEDQELSIMPSRAHSIEASDPADSTPPINEFAIKMLHEKSLEDKDKARHAMRDIQNEVKILSQQDHPNIIRVHAVSLGFWKSDDPAKSFFVMEKLSETLDRSLERWRKEEHGPMPRYFRSKQRLHMCQSRRIQIVALGLARAMEYLHSRDVMYRDLKPTNVGFAMVNDRNDQPVVKLFDFASATLLQKGDSLINARVGTYRYMAPEVALKITYDRKADVYSFGMLLWEICSLEKPYAKLKDKFELSLSVMKRDTHPPLKANYIASDNIRNLLTRCWKPESRERPSFTNIKQNLQKEADHLKGEISNNDAATKTRTTRL
mmetsp:Transcript_23565/g.65565  ORF Transcript_23565/g.65565 Transcript_23565/m.65565 type:complete len:358 (+) Transcript_23565:157-1230(+)